MSTFQIQKYIIAVPSSLLTLVGIIGNTTVLYIITKKEFIKEAMFRYYIVIQVVDYLGLILLWLWYTPIIIGLDVPDLFCMITEYIFYIMYSFYSWVNLLTSTDRLFSVVYPHDFLIRKTFKFQALAVATLFVFSAIINVPNFLYSVKSNLTVCGILDRNTEMAVYSANLIASDVLPYLIMIINNSIIAYNILVRKRRLMGFRIELKKEIQFVKTVFAMDLWFLICYLPFSLFDLIESIFSLENETYWKFVHYITVLLILIQISCNIFVYLLFNKLFRKRFISIFKNS